MNEKTINIISIAGAIFLGLVLLTWFLFANPVAYFVELIPEMDNRQASMSGGSEDVAIGT